MRENKMKAKIQRGETVLGLTVLGNWPEIVEILGYLDLDYVWLDGQHGPLGLNEMAGLVRAAECAGITPIARVPRNDRDIILSYLDLGVQGIICPEVNTRQEAENIVSWCKYPPEGKRGAGYGHFAKFFTKGTIPEVYGAANQETCVILQCESKQGLDNLAEIVAVPGVDIIMIGPMDMSLSLGITGQFDHPLHIAAMAKARKTVVDAGKAVGEIAWDGAYMRKVEAQGVRFMNFGAQDLLIAGIRQYLKDAGKGK